MMKILLLGGGGREHALAWKLAASPSVDVIYAAPGNPGIAALAKCRTIALSLEDFAALADFAEAQAIDLTVVGPEAPLVAGIADYFAARGLALFGPGQQAAQLEGSKAFAKRIMAKYKIPTAYFQVCDDIETAKAYVREKGAPIVVKADGLAAGKGVVVAETQAEALAAIDAMMGQEQFGAAGKRVVLEEFLEGEEASLLAFTDGKTVVPMLASQDHKRAYDGDLGPNTGGMGTYAPAPVLTDVLRLRATEKILKAIIAALAAEGICYRGCLYAGLMLKDGDAKVVEFNCRFGDPETQVLLPLLDGDLAEIMLSCARGTLDQAKIAWKSGAAVCVVVASGGYPASYKKGIAIEGLKAAASDPDVVIFHAGTKAAGGAIVTDGGRVLGVTAYAPDLAAACAKAYAAAGKISIDGAFYRRDIAWRALKP